MSGDKADTELQSLPAVSEQDLASAGFPVGMTMAAGLAVFLNTAMYRRCSAIAVRMADAARDGMLPKHLAGKPAACFAVLSRAIAWNLDPFAVAQCTYQTPGGAVGFEGKLIAAILENSGKIEGGIRYQHDGDWSRVKGKFKIAESGRGGKFPVPTWGAEDAKGLSVTVLAKVKGESEPRTLKVDLDECFPLNSPLWATSPSIQICYLAVRRFANIAMPGILMGIPFDVDPTGFYGEPELTDVTPQKTKAEKPANEFTRKKHPAQSPREEAAFADGERQPETSEAAPKPDGDPKPEPQPDTEPAAEQAADVQEQPTTQAEAVAAAAAGRDDTSDEESPLARGARLLALCKFIPDIADLRASIAEEITDGEKLQAWNAACDARTKEVVDHHNKEAAAAHKKKPGRS